MAEFLQVAGPIVAIAVGLVLIWFLIEAAKTIIVARKAIVDTQKHLEPTLASIETMTKSLEPTVAKIDPLVERVSLTVDATNLEIMRVDEILQNVTTVTDAMASASNAVEGLASAPLNLVNAVSDQIRGSLQPAKTSAQTKALADSQEADTDQANNPFVRFVSEGTDAIRRFFSEKTVDKEKRWEEYLAHLSSEQDKQDDAPARPVARDIQERIVDQLDVARKTTQDLVETAQKEVEKLTHPEEQAYYTYEASSQSEEE